MNSLQGQRPLWGRLANLLITTFARKQIGSEKSTSDNQKQCRTRNYTEHNYNSAIVTRQDSKALSETIQLNQKLKQKPFTMKRFRKATRRISLSKSMGNIANISSESNDSDVNRKKKKNLLSKAMRETYSAWNVSNENEESDFPTDIDEPIPTEHLENIYREAHNIDRKEHEEDSANTKYIFNENHEDEAIERNPNHTDAQNISNNLNEEFSPAYEAVYFRSGSNNNIITSPAFSSTSLQLPGTSSAEESYYRPLSMQESNSENKTPARLSIIMDTPGMQGFKSSYSSTSDSVESYDHFPVPRLLLSSAATPTTSTHQDEHHTWRLATNELQTESRCQRGATISNCSYSDLETRRFVYTKKIFSCHHL